MHPIAQLDHDYVWHPFTQMSDWIKSEPIVLVRGKKTRLWDTANRVYLDANSSIWTNLHGHNHPVINQAIRKQLGRVAHTSALGLANEPASQLAEKLVTLTRFPNQLKPKDHHPLTKVFYSDTGSTAVEVALKMAYEFTRRVQGPMASPHFLSVSGAYHGDTIGAVSLGHIDLFHSAYRGLLFPTGAAMAPYCYRCPHNRADPERADARSYRKCQWECTQSVASAFDEGQRNKRPISAVVYEPLMQGSAGMIAQPVGWLKRVAEVAKEHRALLIADEVLTGFGRAGSMEDGSPTILASHLEGVQPDLVALAKGLTGGYLPMAATLTTQPIFDAFLGDYSDFKTFFHGHSYTANQLGAASALASLEILANSHGPSVRNQLESDLRTALASLWDRSKVGDIRQVGGMVGVELVKDWRRRTPYDLREKAGIRVVQAMARRGVLTRPIGNVVVLIPPYCTTRREVNRMVAVLSDAIDEVLSSG